MAYSVYFVADADNELGRVPPGTRKTLAKQIDLLETDPRPTGSEVDHPWLRCLRVDMHRAFYRVLDGPSAGTGVVEIGYICDRKANPFSAASLREIEQALAPDETDRPR